MTEESLAITESPEWNETIEKMDKFIDTLNINKKDPRRRGELIKVLHRAQHILGFLPEEMQKYVGGKLNLQHAEISGVISFYNYFTTTPKGKYKVAVCTGTACYVKGAGKVLQEFEKQLNIKDGEVTEDKIFSVDSLRCVGACGLAPVVLVNEKVHGSIQAKDVKKILKEYKDLEEAE